MRLARSDLDDMRGRAGADTVGAAGRACYSSRSTIPPPPATLRTSLIKRLKCVLRSLGNTASAAGAGSNRKGRTTPSGRRSRIGSYDHSLPAVVKVRSSRIIGGTLTHSWRDKQQTRQATNNGGIMVGARLGEKDVSHGRNDFTINCAFAPAEGYVVVSCHADERPNRHL